MELIRFSLNILMITLGTSFGMTMTSPFSSTVKGLSTPNAHRVGESTGSTLVLRGQAPKLAEIDQLLELGIERVLIFKNDTKGEVPKEISILKTKGFTDENILQVDMPWKDIQDFQNICEMTLSSLQFIETSVNNAQSVFFHCTVGEDRTGYLAGLWGLWSGHYTSVHQAFQEEMCDRGYEAGDRNKPFKVVQAIRNNLTPAFVKMVQLLADSRRKGLSLSQIQCPRDLPSTRASELRCQ